MLLFYRYPKRIFALVAVILAVEYAIVHRISLDALTRSDVGLSQWRQLLTECNSSDYPVRHLTLIHDGLYQRAYSVHLLHRVLEISSEDGDPYDAFEVDDDEVDNDSADGEDPDDDATTVHVSAMSDVVSVAYAYAPGDMLSNPVPVPAALQPAVSSSSSAAALDVHTLTTADQPSALQLNPRQHEQQQQQQQQQRLGLSGAVAGADVSPSAPGTPPLLQAVVWQPSKVLSIFPWQLRAHVFLSLACTRLYLLMGLWPRSAAVVAAASRRLRQIPQAHTQVHNLQPPASQPFSPGQPHGQDQTTGGLRTSGDSVHPQGQHPSLNATTPGHNSASPAQPQPQHGYMANAGSGFSHPHAQAQVAAHAYAHHAHGYDGLGNLFDFSRTVKDESQGLAVALSVLGRGVPVFLPPEMLVEQDVQEDLMASCVFKPAVKNVQTNAATSGSSSGGVGGTERIFLRRLRAWPSLLTRWVVRVAGRIRHRGYRGASAQHTADMGGGGDNLAAESTSSGAVAVVTRWLNRRRRAGSQQPHQHAYVECRLYRTDRARNASYTCPAMLTVLPSPPSGRSAHLQNLYYQQQQQSQPTHAAGGVGANATHAGAEVTPTNTTAAGKVPQQHQQQPQGPRQRPKPSLPRRLWSDLRYMAYGVIMPYKWAPILAGILSPHMFMLACLPALQSMGFMGPYTAQLCAYHALCIVLTGADHMLLIRVLSELWMRARSRRAVELRQRMRRWMLLLKWLLWDGFMASGWCFRAVVMAIATTKQVELWDHLYGASFRPHPLLSFGLVVPASYLTACALCSVIWRLTAVHKPTSPPMLLFQEGYMSGLAAPINSVVYIGFAVVGLGGGGMGGSAGGVVNLAALGAYLPSWLLDAVVVFPVLTLVALDVLWNMDAAASATPLLVVIVNALRSYHPNDDGLAVAVAQGIGRRARRPRDVGQRLLGAAAVAAAAGADNAAAPDGAVPDGAAPRGNDAGRDWVMPRALVGIDGAVAIKHSTSLWMLLDSARWWAMNVRQAILEVEDELERQRRAQNAPVERIPAVAERLPAVIMRVVMAAGNANMLELPHSVIAGMVATLTMPLRDDPWPPRNEENARTLDFLLEAAVLAAPLLGGPGGAGAGAAGLGAGARQGGRGLDMDFVDPAVDEALVNVLGVGARLQPGTEGGGGEGEQQMVRTSDGTMRPLSSLIAELRAGLAHVAALRAQLAAVGRGVVDLLLLGRWPPPLELPTEVHNWSDAVPHGFLCPITHSIMTQPALLVSPQLSEASPTYELSAIRQWLQTNKTDPTTGRLLQTYHFIHNDNLRKAIEDWAADRLAREQHPQNPQEQQQKLPGQSRQPKQLKKQEKESLDWVQRLQRVQRIRQQFDNQQQAEEQGQEQEQELRQRRGSGAGGAAASAGGRVNGPAAQGPYQPVEGPGPGQRSVCIGTSEVGLRLQSPERFRGGSIGMNGRSPSRGRSRSRGRVLRAAGGAGDGGPVDDRGGAGGFASTAGVLARQAVQRAASRQRGLQRAQPK